MLSVIRQTLGSRSTRLAMSSAASRRLFTTADWILRHLSRETSSGCFIPQMDGLRFVAITLVILFHLNGYLVVKWPSHHAGLLPQSGWLSQTALVGFHGVELFFVISGFILALPFAAHRLSSGPRVELRRYYLRRLTRLEPPYFLTLFLLLTLAVCVQAKPLPGLLPHVAASLIYLHSLIYAHTSPVIGVGWSLEIEVQFYLLVPLLTCLFAIRSKTFRRAVLVVLIVAFSAAQSFFMRDARTALSILAYLQFFVTGFLLADFFVTDWTQPPAHARAWDLVTLVGWPSMIVLLHSQQLAAYLFPFAILLLYCAAFRGDLTRRFFSVSWITAIGGMCYSIYLIHYEVISFVGRFTMRLGSDAPYWTYYLLQFLLVGFAIVTICGLYFVALEKPCMRRDWPQRLRNRYRIFLAAIRSDAEIKAVA